METVEFISHRPVTNNWSPLTSLVSKLNLLSYQEMAMVIYIFKICDASVHFDRVIGLYFEIGNEAKYTMLIFKFLI